ncbi:kinase-like protein [Parathielavia hyrcaniae]|uniref:Kinase-like protein n=1 Tax=Parathielavia hyrcaniae TaxID=113614 RepID=A0AAN6PTZ0_9PEZI|nr:kinase-like protein [Parathielavia hyrcaniae]
MAATIVHSQSGLQSAALVANSGGQLQQQPYQQHPYQQHLQQPPQTGKPFDVAFSKPVISDFVRVRTVGTGTFARVCLVKPSHSRESDSRKLYALKIQRKATVIRLGQIHHVRNERRILAQVRGHPFITNFVVSFSDKDSLYMLLDYVPGGEIFSYLRKFHHFSESVARFYSAEVVLIMEYLHEHQGGIAYRDIKPENLLLDAEGHIKLVDFGFAKWLGTGESGNPNKTYTLCGTPQYIAPEVICGGGYTTAVDWWALGILIYEFLTGYPPFQYGDVYGIYEQILEGTITFPQEPALCTVDSSCRLGNISGGAAKVKAHPFFAGVDWDAVYQKRHCGLIIPPIMYPGDTQCFEAYPEEDPDIEEYTEEMAAEYAQHFEGF